MPNHRTPLAKARATGQDRKNKGRFENRSEPDGIVPLGEPSEFMNDDERGIWEGFKKDFPWLAASDRVLMEIACVLRCKLINREEMTNAEINQLRMCISAMGGTPADRTKITIPDGKTRDPADSFFN
ncbi:hypothetical protein WH95_18520 [Kiloniella litopenaei]|uniref:Terminase n=1 Tax=Kiloniella litopenaei TaxID=1549748 RepID=A0A0M2R1B1_9PROT|nr:hypothetical protein [Kiloniella litopenaei]KKJ75436.1 hypothetical protein WH95_18520 [Kiloniella litopenaei]